MHPPDRVVGVAQDVGRRVGGERRLQRGEVEAPPGGRVGQGGFQQPGSGLGDPVEEWRVHRRADHHRVPWAGQHPEQLHDAHPNVGHCRHRHRVNIPVPPAGSEVGERFAEVRHSPRVPGIGPVHGLAQGFRDRVGQGEVHLGHRQRQHIGWVGLPLRATPLSENLEPIYRQFRYGTVHGHSLPHRISKIKFLPGALARTRAQRAWTQADGALPTLYLSHGAPAPFDDGPGHGNCSTGPGAPKPRSILIVSPHWETAS